MKISKNIFLAFLFVFSLKGEIASQPESSQQEQQEKHERIFSDTENTLLQSVYMIVRDEREKEAVIAGHALSDVLRKTTKNNYADWFTKRIYKECNAQADKYTGSDRIIGFVDCLEEKIIFYKNNPEELQRQIDEKLEKFYTKYPTLRP